MRRTPTHTHAHPSTHALTPFCAIRSRRPARHPARRPPPRLWYVASTHAGLRLMSILAHRMSTEDTWDQAAFGEEVARPARDDHMAAGITKRALNHW